MYKNRLIVLFFIAFSFFSFQKTFAQCFEIESILVDACASGTNEGFNEMVRFKMGPVAQNTSNLVVTWPNNSWQGVIQNADTAAKVAALNADILSAGGCRSLIEPSGGLIPANASVILVSSYLLDTTLNSFGALTSNIYIIFQNNSTVSTGHFANSGTGIRTLSMTFGGTCSDSVSYDRTLLTNGAAGAGGDGATVLYTPSGTASYVNNGCVAPVPLFTVDAGTAPINVCPGAIISLSGVVQGQQSVVWSAPSGSFSNATATTTNYTVGAGATGTIVLTLSATNTCGVIINDTVTFTVNAAVTPTFTAVTPICSGATLSALPTTSTNSVTGTWSPALNNLATTIYTFTPSTGQCANTAPITIVVNPNVIPTFTTVAPICSGATLSALPTTSNNSVTGTWSPALNNLATTTYTFTPSSGQCAVTAPLTIVVNPKITPTFTAVAPICSGTTLTALPTTSNNSVTGTWSPVLNNLATSTYTFTPSSGQCAVTAPLSIVVNPKITPTFTAVSPICSGATLTALPTTSNNSVTGTWSPVLNNLATTTYTFTPSTSECAVTAPLTIVVNPKTTPTFTAVTPICSGATLVALPTTSNNSVTGTWSPALNNLATTIYTFTPSTGECAVTAPLTIVVNPKVTPTFTAVTPICSGATVSALPTNSNNSVTGTWLPALNNLATTTYTFTPSTGQCAVNTNMIITVQAALDFTVSGSCQGNNFVLQLAPIGSQFSPTTTFSWQNSVNTTVGTNDASFNVSNYLYLSSLSLPLPQVISANVTDSNGCVTTKPYQVTSLYCAIQKGISPNGDTDNDYFDLQLLDVKALSIFNRYGLKVYSKANYKKEWYGETDGGKQLPDGTYYYVIELNSNPEVKTGWVYINR